MNIKIKTVFIWTKDVTVKMNLSGKQVMMNSAINKHLLTGHILNRIYNCTQSKNRSVDNAATAHFTLHIRFYNCINCDQICPVCWRRKGETFLKQRLSVRSKR